MDKSPLEAIASKMRRAMWWLERHAAAHPFVAGFLGAAWITVLLASARVRGFGVTSSLGQELFVGFVLFALFAAQMRLATTDGYRRFWFRWRDWMRDHPRTAAFLLGLFGLGAVASLVVAILSSP